MYSTGFAVTVTAHLSSVSPTLAVMVALPGATAVTRPLLLTVATFASLDEYVTVAWLPSEAITFSCCVLPSSKERVVLSNV